MKIIKLKKLALVLVGLFGFASVGFSSVFDAHGATSRTNERIDQSPVGDYTLKERDTWVGRANHCAITVIKTALLPASIAIINNVHAKCDLLDIHCAGKEAGAFTSLATLAAGGVVFTATYFKWKFQNAKFTGTGTSRDNLKTEIANIVTHAIWARSAQNLDDFVDFALGQYETMYRDSSKAFNINAFRSALKGWKP